MSRSSPCPFREADVPAHPRSGRTAYTCPIPVIERARGARWAGQAAKTGEFPDVTVEAAGICPSSKQEPVWRADHMVKPGPHRLQNPALPFNTSAAMRPIYRFSTPLRNSGR